MSEREPQDEKPEAEAEADDAPEQPATAEAAGAGGEAGSEEEALFDPPGYYDLEGEGPAAPADEDVGVRDAEVDGPRRQVGEAAHNPPPGEAPKQGPKQEPRQGEEEDEAS